MSPLLGRTDHAARTLPIATSATVREHAKVLLRHHRGPLAWVLLWHGIAALVALVGEAVARAKGVDQLEGGYPLTPDDLDAAVELARAEVLPGDVVLIRTCVMQLLKSGDKLTYNMSAPGSSLHALDVREFERDGKTWVKFQLVDAKTGQNVEVSRPVVRSAAAKDASGPKRYVVSLKATIAGVAQFTEFALTDRSSYSYPVLIGRNFLRDQAVVDVGHRFTKPD